MGEPHFPICTPEPPPMFGRAQVMRQLVAELTKKTPSHRSIVGPRFSGKSVILKHLANQMRAAGSPYCSVIEWDLGHKTPQTDQEFLVQLCQRLGDGLKQAGQVYYGDHLKGVAESYNSEISEVMDSLNGDGKKVLMIWDGFDKPLCGGALTRNLWDNLRELCLKNSFRIVTATRRELRDLIRDEKSVTSDFWNIFGDIVRVGPFDEQDVEAVLGTLGGYRFEAGAKKELENWSGCFPPFVLGILNEVVGAHQPGEIRNEAVNEGATVALSALTPYIATLWSDCSPAARDLYASLSENGERLVGETCRDARQELIARGFSRENGQKVKAACRLLSSHRAGAGADSGSLSRLFGKWDEYKSNVKALLQHRLAQSGVVDAQLCRYVELAIGLLPNDPDPALNNLTSIEDRALDLIWDKELGGAKVIPANVVSYWTEGRRAQDSAVAKMMRDDIWDIPMDRGPQLHILQLLTGSLMGFDSKTRFVSKDTYVLLNAIHCYRNRNQHPEGQAMHLGVAVAALMTCIELLASLKRDLSAQCA